jgi:hypothetical protein
MEDEHETEQKRGSERSSEDDGGLHPPHRPLQGQ